MQETFAFCHVLIIINMSGSKRGFMQHANWTFSKQVGTSLGEVLAFFWQHTVMKLQNVNRQKLLNNLN